MDKSISFQNFVEGMSDCDIEKRNKHRVSDDARQSSPISAAGGFASKKFHDSSYDSMKKSPNERDVCQRWRDKSPEDTHDSLLVTHETEEHEESVPAVRDYVCPPVDSLCSEITKKLKFLNFKEEDKLPNNGNNSNDSVVILKDSSSQALSDLDKSFSKISLKEESLSTQPLSDLDKSLSKISIKEDSLSTVNLSCEDDKSNLEVEEAIDATSFLSSADHCSLSVNYDESEFEDWHTAIVDEEVEVAKEAEPAVDKDSRVMKDVPHPAKERLGCFKVFDENGAPRHEVLRKHFIEEGRLEEQCALEIIKYGGLIMKQEPNVLEIAAPINICGDVHGQYYDLMKLFELGGSPVNNKYLFLGDYVDRGYFSIECVLYLLSLKICFPRTFFLLRGNHESRHLTEYFTFKEECELKYSHAVYKACMKTFDSLPLAAVVNDEFFCVHGGLSPEITSVKDINQINRFIEPPSHGAFCDLLWADPREDFGREKNDAFFTVNETRGCSFYYSYKACCDFVKRNNLLGIIRAHEAQEAGYKLYRSTSQGFPSLCTVFSAPNYLDTYMNKGAFIRYANETFNLKQFCHSPHPYWLPNFQDVFSWSMPFIAQQCTQMLLGVLHICSSEELENCKKDNHEEKKRKDVIRNKIKSVGKLARTFAVLKEEKEAVLKLKGLSPNNKLPLGALSEGKSSLLGALKKQLTFDEVKDLDSVNERMPPHTKSD